jgi:hypothetical protein
VCLFTSYLSVIQFSADLSTVVPLVPSRDWSQQHSQPNPKEPENELKPSLLGLSMRLCDPEPSLDNVWHVMDVFEG